jgi:hypothetical protein
MAAAVEMTRTEPKMNTFTNTPHARSYFIVTGLVSLLLGSLPGCYIDAKIGDDPEAGTGATEDDATTSATGFSTTMGSTGAPGDDITATSGLPGTASVSTTSGGSISITATGDSAGEDITATGGGPGVDPETALELCGVEVTVPGPGDPVFETTILCAGGCVIPIVSVESTDFYSEYGECLCDAMDCGPPGGTSTSSGGPLPETESGSSDGGEPDGCGPFPPGESGFTCSCEMCSIDVTSVDAEWLDIEADLETICECMCGGAGCGSPL